MIKLLLLDVDGCLTSGWKTYDIYGNIISKQFYDKDFDYTDKIINQLGIPVVWISGDHRCNAGVAKKRGYPFINAMDKENYLDMLCKEYGVSPEEVGFLADSRHDIPLLLKVGYPMTVYDCDLELFEYEDLRSIKRFDIPVMNQVYEYILDVNNE